MGAAKSRAKRKVTRKRGRPSLTQVAEIDATVISAARSLFLTNGYANTSMEAVAATAGISKPALYARYTDKAELFNAVVSERLAAWKPEDSAWTSHKGLPDLLFHFGVTFLREMRDPEKAAFHHLIWSEADRCPELVGQFFNQGYFGAAERLGAAITQAAKHSRWSISDGISVAHAFLSALYGWNESEPLRRKVDDDDCSAYVARLVAIFAGGRTAW